MDGQMDGWMDGRTKYTEWMNKVHYIEWMDTLNGWMEEQST